MDAKKIVIIFAVLLMLTGGTISVLKWLQIGPFSNSTEGIAGTILIELKVEAIGLENQEMITKLLPRLSNAFFKDLYVFIPQLIRRKIKLTTMVLSERMQKVADKLFGPDVLHKVIIVKVTDS